MSNNDIILVSETHLSRDIDNEDIQLRGFQNPIRVDRNRHGGGVAIFAKPNIYICEKPEFHTSEIEILWLEVILNNLKAMVGVIYRPPTFRCVILAEIRKQYPAYIGFEYSCNTWR